MQKNKANLLRTSIAVVSCIIIVLIIVLIQNHNNSDIQSSNSSSSTPSCFTANQAANEIGHTGCVQFTGYAYTSSKGEMYLDQSLSAPYGFAAYIPAGYSFGPGALNQYNGQSIDVTGTITSYEGEPQITVTSVTQITFAQ